MTETQAVALTTGKPLAADPSSPLALLIDQPARFSFDAAVAVLMQVAGTTDPGAAISFHAVAGLAFAAADIAAVKRDDGGFHVTTGILGLSGPSGVLPRPYSEIVNAEYRHHAPALGAFLDLLAQRPITQAASAGMKYRPHRGSTPNSAGSGKLRRALLALTGYGTPHLADRLATGTQPLLFYAGFFATRVRSADRLQALLSDWLGHPVDVEQFAGEWLKLGPEQRSRLPCTGNPGCFSRLGVDAAIGSRYWDPHARICLRIGPLPLNRFEALLPDRPLLRCLASLVCAYLGGEPGFSVNPILAADAVPPLRLCRERRPRLGWNSWLPTAGGRRRDGTEAAFGDESIEPLEDS